MTETTEPRVIRGDQTETLPEALAREIGRVRAIQDQYKSLRGMPNVIVEPQIQMMEHEIAEAISACGSGDVERMIRAYQTLRENES